MPGLGNGGAERVFLSLYQSFLSSGFDVEILCATPKVFINYDQSIKISFLDSRYAYLSFFKYKKYIYNSKPDIVIATLQSSIFISNFAKFFSVKNKYKLISRIANVYQKPKNFLQMLLLFSQRISIRFSDGVIFNSQATKESIEKLLKIKFNKEKMEILNNPVLEKNFESRISKLRSSNFKKQFIFIGRLVPQKRVEDAIKAFEIAFKEDSSINMIIIGNGPEKSKALRLVELLKIQKAVTFYDYYEDIPNLLANSCCLINTSAYEGFGNVFVEGLAFCNNLVSYNSPGGASEILKGTKAVLIEDGNYRLMGNKLIEISSSKDINFLCSNYYLSKFSSEKIAKEYLKFIRKII